MIQWFIRITLGIWECLRMIPPIRIIIWWSWPEALDSFGTFISFSNCQLCWLHMTLPIIDHENFHQSSTDFFPGRLCWLHHRPSIIYPSTGGRAPACDRCHGCVCPASTKSGRIWSSSFSSAGYIYGYIYGHISIANMIISIYVFSFPDLPQPTKLCVVNWLLSAGAGTWEAWRKGWSS